MTSERENVKGVTLYKPDRCYHGYTLFCHTHEDPRLGEDLWAYMYLINMQGGIVHQWTAETAVQLLKLQPDGTLYYMTRDRSNIDEAGIRRIAPDSSVLWYYHCRADHDYYPLGNGHMILHTIADHMAPALGSGLRRHPYFLEIDSEGKLLWEWHGEEHLQELTDLAGLQIPIDWEARCAQEVELRRSWDPTLQEATPQELEETREQLICQFSFDWAHNNTCQVIEENAAAAEDARFRPGNIIFSYRTLDIIGVIDRDTGEIVWAWGPGIIDGQHKPHMLPNGHILLFDNGTRRGWSRVIEMDPLSGEIVWEYTGSPREQFFSGFISGAQRLPDGNTLICEGGKGRLFEVTPEKEIVWEFLSPFRGIIQGREAHNIYRATRYAPEYVA
ncbi:MAG: aryl-sulfate sulfotransferase, partial [Anaerolineales bacterium]